MVRFFQNVGRFLQNEGLRLVKESRFLSVVGRSLQEKGHFLRNEDCCPERDLKKKYSV